MKLRVRLLEKATIAGSGSIPPSRRLSFGPNGQEDAHFVAVGQAPGRHVPMVRLALESLTVEAGEGFEFDGEYLLTLERVARQ